MKNILFSKLFDEIFRLFHLKRRGISIFRLEMVSINFIYYLDFIKNGSDKIVISSAFGLPEK